MKLVVVFLFFVGSFLNASGQQTSCRTPPNIEYGETVFTPGSQDLTFTCNVGYTLIGDFNINCTCGVWSINGFCQVAAAVSTTPTPTTTTTAGPIQQCFNYSSLTTTAQVVKLPLLTSDTQITLTVSKQTGNPSALLVTNPSPTGTYFGVDANKGSDSVTVPGTQYYIDVLADYATGSATNVQVCYKLQSATVPDCVNNAPTPQVSAKLCRIKTASMPTKALFWTSAGFYLLAYPTFQIDWANYAPTNISPSSGNFSAPLVNTYYALNAGAGGSVNWAFTY